MANPVEVWKSQKHGFDVWGDVLNYASAATPMKDIDTADLERMKWHGVFYRKRDTPGSYMLRLRLTGCELTAAQAKEIAYVAYECGYGIVDVTTRANIQIQGLHIEHVPRAIERLAAVGITAKQTGHDNIRNVFCHPLSGADPEELIDTRTLCHDVTNVFLESRTFSDLPRKFNIALSGRPEHSVHYWSQDLSFLACELPSGEIGFQILVGGTQGQNPRLPWHLGLIALPEQASKVTESLLELFRQQGSREKRDRARFRYLIEQLGLPAVRQHVMDQVPGLLPDRQEPLPATSYDELVGWFRQKQRGTWAMGLSAPLGRLTWQQLDGIARASRKWADGTLRTTPEQGLIVLNVPGRFKDAIATDIAAVGISVHADTLALNTVACTGKQFCNIAVTETKGYMLQLIEKLRERALTLHGIRIHMSGCPSSCAQHFTADIGLKGVRVRRLLGTREGFDMFLGGGVSSQVHLALPYKYGVDVDQLPQAIEEVVQKYYLNHQPGQTFSAYWREELQSRAATNVADGEYCPPVWICEGCEHRHVGEDPPIFCPKCAGLRRLFARLDLDALNEPSGEAGSVSPVPSAPGYQFAMKDEAVTEGAIQAIELAGKQIALYRIKGQIYATDNACPHEGAPLSQGEIQGSTVTCPWHGWTFNACTGCSLEPKSQDLAKYETLLEDGNVFIKLGSIAGPAAGGNAPPVSKGTAAATPVTCTLAVLEVIDETHDVKTFRLDNRAGTLPAHLAGQFVKVKVTVDGEEIWRSFTISSSPARGDTIDLTIKRNLTGKVSCYLHDFVTAGAMLTVKGPQGGFYFDPDRHREPLVLISAGSGITPMLSIARSLCDTGSTTPCIFVHGARAERDIIAQLHCQQMQTQLPNMKYALTLSQPSAEWTGNCGRVDLDTVRQHVPDIAAARYFLCGPNSFMDALRAELLSAGVPDDRIHTEQFHSSKPAAVATSG